SRLRDRQFCQQARTPANGSSSHAFVSGPASALISQAGQTLSLIRDHSPHLGCIRFADQCIGIQVAFALGGFGGQYMALKSLAPLDLAGGSLLESLGCAFVGLHFWHKFCRSRVPREKLKFLWVSGPRRVALPAVAVAPVVAASAPRVAAEAVAAAAAFPAAEDVAAFTASWRPGFA